MKPSSFRLGLVQMSCEPSASANLDKAAAKVREAAGRGAQIICLQELFRTPYFCQREDPAVFDLAEAVPGPTTELFGRIAKEAGVVVVASVFERRAAGLHHNTAVVIDADGTIAGIYRKMHIPDDPLYYEKYYFAPGDLGFRAFSTRFGKVGTLVCWDQWYPEAARLTAMQGADLLVYPTAIGWHPLGKGEIRGLAACRVGNDPARRTPSPTASSSPPSIASATKVTRRPVSIFGAALRRQPVRRAARERVA